MVTSSMAKMSAERRGSGEQEIENRGEEVGKRRNFGQGKQEPLTPLLLLPLGVLVGRVAAGEGQGLAPGLDQVHLEGRL